MDNNRLIGMLCALLAALIWSGFILVSRMGGISALTSYDVIAIRYATCAFLLFPIWLLFFRFNLLKFKFIASACIGGLAYALFAFKGFEKSSALHGGILLPGLIPVFVAIFSLIIVKTKLSRNKAIGLSLIMLAISLLFYSELMKTSGVSTQETILGDMCFIMAAVFWALFTVLINIWNISPWQATCSLAFISCALYLPVYLIWLPKNIEQVPLSEIGLQVIYQGFLATIIQMLLYVKAVKLIGAQGMGTFMALVPVFAGIMAVMILGEHATWYLWSALLLVSLGVLISNLSESIKLNYRFDN